MRRCPWCVRAVQGWGGPRGGREGGRECCCFGVGASPHLVCGVFACTCILECARIFCVRAFMHACVCMRKGMPLAGKASTPGGLAAGGSAHEAGSTRPELRSGHALLGLDLCVRMSAHMYTLCRPAAWTPPPGGWRWSASHRACISHSMQMPRTGGRTWRRCRATARCACYGGGAAAAAAAAAR